jgi:hypothetical protein
MNDFPLTVALGKTSPTWGLSRWKNKGLRFIPSDDEGFAIRGDKQRLIYKGRRKSHRFTILSDTAFEYDCILLKEPETNIISLRMEGAEKFNFFRQPDSVKEPFLKGSYAVYKKENLLGEGTGKLCHLHRPEIIDARGRRCWGDLAVIGNELRITIPEWWLSEAKYPVIVDPTIGTATVGSQIPESNTPSYRANIAYEYSVNNFIVPETFSGECHAYIFNTGETLSNGYYTPLIFNDLNGKPRYRLTQNETPLIGILKYQSPLWLTTNFFTLNSITQGDTIWFGGYGDPVYVVFDYGGINYRNFKNKKNNDFPHDGQETSYNFIISWYFDYTPLGTNYVRTITQGVSLADNLRINADYKRISTQTVQADTEINKLQAMYRNIQEAIKCLDNNFSPVLFFRKVYDAVNVSDTLKQLREIFVGLFEILTTNSNAKSGRVYFVNISDSVYAVGVLFRTLFLFVKIITKFFISDYILNRFLIAKAELKIKSCIVREIVIESRIN